MKKVYVKISVITIIIVLAALCTVTVFAANSAALTGPGTVRAWDTITVTFAVNGQGIEGMSGDLVFDGSQVSLASTSQSIGSPWVVEFNGNTFAAYDNDLAAPINSNKNIFTAKFNVKNLPQGTKVNISIKNITLSDGSNDIFLPDTTYSFTIAPPLSSDATLKALTVEGVTLSPAFSPDVTTYSAEVPYQTSKINVKATPNDGGASASVSGTNLSVGSNTITVTVKAANGTKKDYTLKIKRNMNDSATDSSLSWISVDNYENCLSPKFSSSVKNYVLWLPNETSSVNISATVHDKENAKIQSISGNKNLVAGADNTISVVCQAGNGSTTTYTIIAKRAAGGDEPTVREISGSVSIKGTPEPGERLTAEAEGLEDATVTYTWFAEGEQVGTGISYNPANSDTDKEIFVKIEGTGLYSGSISSEKVKVTKKAEPEEEPVEIKAKVTVRGEAKIGQTLTAEISDLPEGANVKCQWFSNDVLSGEGTRYNVACADEEKEIYCVVTGVDGFTGSCTSEKVKVEKAGNDEPHNTDEPGPAGTPTPGKSDDPGKTADPGVSPTEDPDNNREGGKKKNNPLFIIGAGVICLIIGLAVGFIVGKKKK